MTKQSLIVNATVLANAMKAAEKVVASRNTTPILDMVRIEAQNDILTITTTNLDIEYRQSIEASTTGSLSVCVDAKRLSAMAGAAKNDMTMALDDNKLVIKAGRSRWSAPTLPVDDWPEINAGESGHPVEFSAGQFGDIFKKCFHAVSNEDVRFYLKGLFFNDEDGRIRSVSTDGSRLVSVLSDIEWPCESPDVIVPLELCEIIASASERSAVEVSWNNRSLIAKAGDVTITGMLIEGTYPDYRRVIPGIENVMQVNASDLSGAVRRVRIASDSKQRTLRLNREDGAIDIQVEGSSGFEGRESVQAQCDDSAVTGVNADFLLAMLNACGDDDVRISQKDASSPMRFDPVDNDGFIGVVMPMRI